MILVTTPRLILPEINLAAFLHRNIGSSRIVNSLLANSVSISYLLTIVEYFMKKMLFVALLGMLSSTVWANEH
ncbi:MAG: hypothetical protein ACXV8P_07790, partial [Methylobacter sp.]